MPNSLDVLRQIDAIVNQNNELEQGVLLEFDWDSILMMASSGLILPHIYVSLRTKKALEFLEADFADYLHEIYRLNKERNEAILNQAQVIAKTLQEEDIEFVFLKCTALLISDYYSDIGSRMVGDIDLLVNEQDQERADALFRKAGYINNVEKSNIGKLDIADHRHLSRLVHPDYIGAVEIHKKVTDQTIESLDPLAILKDKEECKGMPIPNLKHLCLHNIYNWQLNDNGYILSMVGFRSYCDSLVFLQKNKTQVSALFGTDLKTKKYASLLSTFSAAFQSFSPFAFSKMLFKASKKNKLFNSALYYMHYMRLITFKAVPFLVHRSFLFVTHKGYRKAAWKDRHRIANPYIKLSPNRMRLITVILRRGRI